MQSSGQVLTVALNATVDTVYAVDRLAPGCEHDLRLCGRTAGGNGNNVARVLATLGHSTVATGFLGGSTGRFIAEGLQSAGVANRFLSLSGESRTCITLLDQAAGTQTLLREPGLMVTEADRDRFLDHFTRLLRGVDFVVLSGSLPPGLPDDLYGQLVSIAYRTAQVRSVVDARGAVLQGALSAQPYMVKPNLKELSEWVGRPLTTEQQVLEGARTLMAAGPLSVAVSMGSRGLILVSPEGSWKAVPPQITAVNSLGSGDALVAGLLAGLLEGRSAAEILRMAVAAGAANALHPRVGEVDQMVVAQLLRQVRVTRLA